MKDERRDRTPASASRQLPRRPEDWFCEECFHLWVQGGIATKCPLCDSHRIGKVELI